MIIKIQKPIVTTEEVPQALIYDRDRTVQLTVPFTDVEELFGPFQLKVYARAKIKGKNLVIQDVVPDQDW
jgi:hypothetical protein